MKVFFLCRQLEGRGGIYFIFVREFHAWFYVFDYLYSIIRRRVCLLFFCFKIEKKLEGKPLNESLGRGDTLKCHVRLFDSVYKTPIYSTRRSIDRTVFLFIYLFSFFLYPLCIYQFLFIIDIRHYERNSARSINRPDTRTPFEISTRLNFII